MVNKPSNYLRSTILRGHRTDSSPKTQVLLAFADDGFGLKSIMLSNNFEFYEIFGKQLIK